MMQDEFVQYEEECERIRAENDSLLDGFADWLYAKGLTDKTVGRHCYNMDFYLNHFLLYEDAQDAVSG